MMRSLIRRSAVLLLGLGSLLSIPSYTPSSSAQEPDFTKTQIQTIPLANNLYMMVGEGGNLGVSVGADGVFLIDDQFAPLTEKIQMAIGKLSDQPIRFLINTHWHADHTGGNENLGRAGATIVAHDNVRSTMSVHQRLSPFNWDFPPSPSLALPVITFNDTTTFHLNGETIRAFHIKPAHTDGDVVIHFQKANVVHTGDLYFNSIYPFIDVEHGGNLKGMIAGVEQLLSLVDAQTKIIPGHGSLSNRAELQRYHTMLSTVYQRTQAAIDSGQSLETFLASNPLADLEETWGKGFLSTEQFLRIVWSDLSR